MLSKFITTIILACYTSTIFACEKPVTYIRKSEAAPCEGFIFSFEKEREMRLINEDYKYLKQESEIKDKMLNNYKLQVGVLEDISKKEAEKAELWRNKAESSTLKYIEEQDSRGKRDLLFLIGGILVTVAAGFAVGQANK